MPVNDAFGCRKPNVSAIPSGSHHAAYLRRGVAADETIIFQFDFRPKLGGEKRTDQREGEQFLRFVIAEQPREGVVDKKRFKVAVDQDALNGTFDHILKVRERTILVAARCLAPLELLGR